jgi:hypothetical protein
MRDGRHTASQKKPAAIAIVHAGRQESRDARRHNKPHAPRRQPLRPHQSSSGMRTSPHGALQTSGGGRWLPAVPLKQMHRVAVHVAEHLELHVARLREVPAATPPPTGGRVHTKHGRLTQVGKQWLLSRCSKSGRLLAEVGRGDVARSWRGGGSQVGVQGRTRIAARTAPK